MSLDSDSSRAGRGGIDRALPRLHVVTSDTVISADPFVDRAHLILEAGGSGVALQLRAPGASGRDLYRLAESLAPVARRSGSTLLVSDRIDVARTAGAHGAHLPGHGLGVTDARTVWPEALLGVSVHSAEEAGAALGADYLTAGTLFESGSHPGRPGAGLERLHEVRAAVPDTPLLGIGGVDPERARAVRAAGGFGVAVISAVWGPAATGEGARFPSADEMEERVRTLLEAVGTPPGPTAPGPVPGPDGAPALD